MEGHTIEEAAILLKQSADFLRNKILFAGQAHPILKPCVYLPEPRSLRIINSDGKINEYGVDYVKKIVPVPCSDGRTRGCSYDSANIQGLFELTFFPDNFDMAEAKESGRIQLYSPKAVLADRLAEFSIDMAVGWIMSGWKDFDEIHNRWYAMTTSEASSTKSRIRSKIGQFIILSQNGIHYLVDSPASISLSDICITDKMLSEYAASEGIKLSFPPMETAPRLDQSAKKATVYYTQEEAAAILEMTEEEIFRLSSHERLTDEKRIFAGMLITKPLSVLRVRTTGKKMAETHLAEYGGGLEYVATEESISGFFELIDLPEMQDKTWTKPITRLSAYESGDWFQIPGGKSFKKSDFRYSRASLKHYAESMRRDIAFPDAMPEIKLRHKITKVEQKPKGKSAIQLAVEAFLDDSPEGNKAGFYIFLKKQLNLSQEQPFKDDQPYAYYFKDVKGRGIQEGVYLHHPKEGKKEGNPSWNHYSGNEISAIISKEKKKRKSKKSP